MALGRSTRPVEPAVAPPPRPPEPAPPVTARAGVNPWKLVAGSALIVLGLVSLVYYSYLLRSVIVLTLVALLLAVGLQGPVIWLRRLGLPRPLGLLTIYVAVIVGLGVAGSLLLPPVVRDLRELAVQAPNYVQGAQDQLSRFGVTFQGPILDDLEARVVETLSNDIGSYVGRLFSILNFTFGLLGGFLNGLLVLVLSIFFIMEGPTFRAHVLSLLSRDNEQKWEAITTKIAVKIQGWMLGTLFLGLILWAVTTAALLLLGMPYAFLFGLVAGIGEFIPMIGPIIAAIPAVSVAAFLGWPLFVAILVLYIVIQQVENYVLVPRVMGRSVDLPGLVVLVAFLIGSELYGVLGAILATPVAAVGQVLWLDWIVPAIRSTGRVAPVSVRTDVERRATRSAPERSRAPASSPS
jgi:predicted PurR-regulated permease PerM